MNCCLKLCVLRVALLAAVMACASGCSSYLLGDSRYPHYYGGQGGPVRNTTHVPKEIQR